MTVEVKALDTILELDDSEISDKEEVNKINNLNSLYKKQELNEKFEDLEKFETCQRPRSTPMQQFLFDFDGV